HGAFVANGLKRAHLIQFRRAMRPAHLTHGGSFARLVRGVFNVSGARANESLIPVTSLTTSPPLARALAERNYQSLTPVQTAVLADDASGRHLLGSAQTSSGQNRAH